MGILNHVNVFIYLFFDVRTFTHYLKKWIIFNREIPINNHEPFNFFIYDNEFLFKKIFYNYEFLRLTNFVKLIKWIRIWQKKVFFSNFDLFLLVDRIS